MPKVLLVDDEPHISAFISTQLETIQFKVVGCATSGAEAFEQVKRVKPDLVLLDITMPGMTGDELIPELLALREDLFIVMLTSRNSIDLVKHCVELGVKGYILKNEPAERICSRLQEIWFSKLFKSKEPT